MGWEALATPKHMFFPAADKPVQPETCRHCVCGDEG